MPYAQRLDYIAGAVRDPNIDKVHAVSTAAGLYCRSSEGPKQRQGAFCKHGSWTILPEQCGS
jgi:hypothetical protein